MQRDPRMLGLLIASFACRGMRKRALAILQRLTFKAASANRSRSNDPPPGIPYLDPSLVIHNPGPIPRRFEELTIHSLQPISYARNHTLL